jgi:hypothetical protein
MFKAANSLSHPLLSPLVFPSIFLVPFFELLIFPLLGFFLPSLDFLYHVFVTFLVNVFFVVILLYLPSQLVSMSILPFISTFILPFFLTLFLYPPLFFYIPFQYSFFFLSLYLFNPPLFILSITTLH